RPVAQIAGPAGHQQDDQQREADERVAQAEPALKLVVAFDVRRIGWRRGCGRCGHPVGPRSRAELRLTRSIKQRDEVSSCSRAMSPSTLTRERYMTMSLARRAIGCCISSRSPFTRFSP